jgi:hypothetical protein
LRNAEEGTGPQENVERFRQKIRDLEAEQAKFGSLKTGDLLEQRDVAPAPLSRRQASFGGTQAFELSLVVEVVLERDVRRGVVVQHGKVAGLGQ